MSAAIVQFPSAKERTFHRRRPELDERGGYLQAWEDSTGEVFLIDINSVPELD